MVKEASTRRAPRFGPETWQVRGGRDWSLWDLWFCAVAVVDHDGDLGALAGVFVEALRAHGLVERDANEAKLSHLADLRARLSGAGLDAADLADADVRADTRILRRAREKVVGRRSLEQRACSPAMIDTPRRRLQHRARYGHWTKFPSDPARFYEKFRSTVLRKDHVPKGRTFAVVSRLEGRLDGLDGPRRTLPDRLALYRAFHTAGLELADAADDSYGNIGEARTRAWLTYLGIDWRTAGIEPAAYWQDLCELRVWEPYAVDHQRESAWFRGARHGDVELIEGILLAAEEEYRGVVLDWEADESLQALADLYLATRSRERYVAAAGRLGSQWWRPIEAMAASQLEVNDNAGAVAVFEAADQPGWHREHLRKRCRELTGVDLDSDTMGNR
ncbi:MAG: hypothetical protein IT198_08250 [Acidimicrobiia bacterium]|nr:hypothetical protein [Acidimicrobiia bacterium]